MQLPIIVKVTPFSLHVQAPVGNASKRPKVATKVSSVFGNDSDEDSWSLLESGSTYKENDFKDPWKREMPCMYRLLFCHWLGLAMDGGISTASREQTRTWTQPCELYEVEGTLYNEICIVFARFWKLFVPFVLATCWILKAICTIRPCNRTMPFNLQSAFVVCTTIVCF